jgi:hypothetical protein
MKHVLFFACLISIAAAGRAIAAPQIRHDTQKKCVTMTDGQGALTLRLRYDGRCVLDRVAVRGQEVVSAATGVYSSMHTGTYGGEDRDYSTRSGIPSPSVDVGPHSVTVGGIRFGGYLTQVEERWSFDLQPDCIDWRITRHCLNGCVQKDAGFPRWDFQNLSTWTGALLGTGGVAWFKLFHDQEIKTPLATYGVHAGPVTFWNQATGACLQIVPTVPPDRHAAVKFSRQEGDALAFSYRITEQELTPQHGLCRFLWNKQDVWAPQWVSPEEVSVAYRLSAPDYAKAYCRGILRGIDEAAVREICNTIGRLGVIDDKFVGSNGWYSGYVCLQEQWHAQLGLAIDDPAYTRNYTRNLDYEREHAIGADGRVKARWCYGPWDAMPGTYDPFGYYEAQWGYFLDSQPDQVINVAEQFDCTGDLKWLHSHKAACERVLDYMLGRDSNHNGLVEIMTDSHKQQRGGDWLDVIWVSFEAASINAQMYYAMVSWADCEDVLGDRQHAAEYRAAATRLKTTFNKTTAEGGFWNPDRKWYVYWRDRDGSVHGDNLVLPVNFMAIAYGLCDDPQRRDAILAQTEAAMQKERLFFWPACIYSFQQDELLNHNQWPFPGYENGDIFLSWGEVALRAYAPYDPSLAVRYLMHVLDQYKKDGLAVQRYLRKTQRGAGNDILSGNALPVVGLYRDIYGVQPKWNRLYLEPHLVPALNGTQLRYWLRDQWYTVDLSTQRCRIAVGDFAVSDRHPFAVNVHGDTAEYYCGARKSPSMTVTRSTVGPVAICIEAWPAAGVRRWSETHAKSGTSVRHGLSGLAPAATFKLSRNGGPAESLRSDAAGNVVFAHQAGDGTPQTFELTVSPTMPAAK